MNSKQRVMDAVCMNSVDRLPCYYFATEPINGQMAGWVRANKYEDRYGLSTIGPNDPYAVGNIRENMIADALGCDVCYIEPRLKPGKWEMSMGDVHAAIYDGKGASPGTEAKYPLGDINQAEDVARSDRWPSPDWYEYEIHPSLRGFMREKAVVAYNMGILFLYAMSMRGMEEIMVDMAVRKEIAHAIFDRITGFNLERTRRFLEANRGAVDIVGVGDDVAGQRSLLMSPAMWREMIRPYLERMVALCQAYGVIPYFHGCGGFTELFDEFIRMGIKCVGKLQPEARGNAFSAVKEAFGDRICLWGAIDAQRRAIEGSEKEVRDHIRNLRDINRDHAGFVIGPSHSFTQDTPIRNIITIYDALKTG